MKKIILLTIALFIAVLVHGQSDYDSYMRKGVTAMENADYKSAENTFKAARKAARQDKDKDTRKKFDDLVKKVNRYQDYSKHYRSGKSKSNLKDAVTSLRKANSALSRALSIKNSELSSVDAKTRTNLDKILADTEARRVAKMEADFSSGRDALSKGSYSIALMDFRSAKANMFDDEIEKNRMSKWITHAEAGTKMDAGDKSFASGNYLAAYRSYKSARATYSSIEGISNKIGDARGKVCGQYSNTLDMVNNGKSAIATAKTIAEECECDQVIRQKIVNADLYFLIIQRAEKLESEGDKQTALAEYRDAQVLAPTSAVNRKVSSLEGDVQSEQEKEVAATQARMAQEEVDRKQQREEEAAAQRLSEFPEPVFIQHSYSRKFLRIRPKTTYDYTTCMWGPIPEERDGKNSYEFKLVRRPNGSYLLKHARTGKYLYNEGTSSAAKFVLSDLSDGNKADYEFYLRKKKVTSSMFFIKVTRTMHYIKHASSGKYLYTTRNNNGDNFSIGNFPSSDDHKKYYLFQIHNRSTYKHPSTQQSTSTNNSTSTKKGKVTVKACCYGSDWSSVGFRAENAQKKSIEPSTSKKDDAVFYLSDGTYTIHATAIPYVCYDQTDPHASAKVVVRNGVASPNILNLKLK